MRTFAVLLGFEWISRRGAATRCARSRALALWLAGAGTLLATACGAQPVAPWAPAADLPEAVHARFVHHVRSRCVPDRREVAYPVFPGALLISVDWGRVKPTCVPRDGWSDLGGLALVSVAAEADVANWYAERLVDHVQYDAAPGRLFMRAQIPEFLWDRDYHKHPNVAIVPAPGAWLAAGYRTMIELNRPAP
jgi:hypothetical protein